MRILFNVGRFNGGAPLSILEYIKIADYLEREVIAVGEYSSNENKYEDYAISTTNIPRINYRRPFKSLSGLIKYIKIVKKYKPDLIHATSYGIFPSKLVSILFGIPTLYSIPGGNMAGELATYKILNDDHVIVYSIENKRDLISQGYSPDKIKVISNRLPIKRQYNHLNIYSKPTEQIRLLMISRLDTRLINSVKYVLNIVDKLSFKYVGIILNVVGDGELINEVKQEANKINNRHDRKVVFIQGYKNNVNEYILNSHIVFGKGRSILEAMILERISFTVGEENMMSQSLPTTFNDLYEYNFSGRNLKNAISLEEFSLLIEELLENDVNHDELEKIRILTEEHYDIDYAKEEIEKIYSSNFQKKSKQLHVLPALNYFMNVLTAVSNNYIKNLMKK